MGKLVSKSKTPVRDKFLPYGHQWIHDEDIDAVVKALRNDWVSQDSKQPEGQSSTSFRRG